MTRLSELILCLVAAVCLTVAQSTDQLVETNVKLQKQAAEPIKPKPGKSAEDQIPVIEIKGEGKPMTAAQIRSLEEEAEGKPLDIKIKKTWVPRDCPKKAKRRDFITFHYKAYLEDGKKIDQSYGKDPIVIQLGVGMTMPGMDKGLRGVCEEELRKINIPWRLSRRKKSRVWKNIPKEEHWLIFDVEIFKIDQWTPKLQFQYFDANNDSAITATEFAKHAEKLRKDFGKSWPSDDIDNVLASKYFVEYFDSNEDNKVDLQEYQNKMESDEKEMNKISAKNKPQGRKRDPGLGWILDFNNDGIVTMSELDAAPNLFEKGPSSVHEWLEAQSNSTKFKSKDEL